MLKMCRELFCCHDGEFSFDGDISGGNPGGTSHGISALWEGPCNFMLDTALNIELTGAALGNEASTSHINISDQQRKSNIQVVRIKKQQERRKKAFLARSTDELDLEQQNGRQYADDCDGVSLDNNDIYDDDVFVIEDVDDCEDYNGVSI